MATSTYRIRRAKNLCGRCGKTPDSGGATCLKCRAYERTKAKRPNERAYRRKLAQELKAFVFAAYGGAICVCCQESNIKFLTLDHIANDGGKQRKELKLGGSNFYRWLRANDFPPGLQVLCYNCNLGRAKNNGICPHKEEKCKIQSVVMEDMIYMLQKSSTLSATAN